MKNTSRSAPFKITFTCARFPCLACVLITKEFHSYRVRNTFQTDRGIVMYLSRGGFKISGKGFICINALLVLSIFFLSIIIWSHHFFHFHRIFKKGDWGGGSSETPKPHLDPTLFSHC